MRYFFYSVCINTGRSTSFSAEGVIRKTFPSYDELQEIVRAKYLKDVSTCSLAIMSICELSKDDFMTLLPEFSEETK